MSRHRTPLTLLVVAALTGTFAACGGDDSTTASTAANASDTTTANTAPGNDDVTDGSGTVELVYTYDSELGQPIKDVLATMERGPEVALTIAGEDYEDVLTRLAADRTAGTLPDIAMIGLDTARTVADAGLAVPLDDLLGADETIDPADFSQAAIQAVTFDDQLYGMPCMGTASPILYFNADVFTAAGLDPNDPPDTWSEITAASAQIVASGAADFGIYYIPNSYLFQSALYSNGGALMDDGREELELDSPEATEVLDYYRDLVQQGYMPNAPEAAGRDSFLQGDTAMLVTSSSGVANFAANTSFDLRTGLFPIPDDGARMPVMSGNTFMIVTDDPAQQQAAWQVLAHMCSPESSTIFGSKVGYIPFSVTAQGIAAANQPIENAGYTQTEHLTPWFNFPGENAVEITTAINEMVQAAYAGEDVDGALSGAVDTIESLLP